MTFRGKTSVGALQNVACFLKPVNITNTSGNIADSIRVALGIAGIGNWVLCIIEQCNDLPE